MTAAPYDLCAEYLRAPISVGTRSPRFSWFVDHLRAACELEVSTAGRVVWASGEIETADAAPVVYSGESLILNTAYGWRVRSRAAEGE